MEPYICVDQLRRETKKGKKKKKREKKKENRKRREKEVVIRDSQQLMNDYRIFVNIQSAKHY